MGIRIAINGFGRIGKLVFRYALENPEIEIIAINDLYDSETMAHLLQFDSLHGTFDGNISVDGKNIIVNDNKIKVLNEKEISKLPWNKLDIDIVVESTGFFKDKEKLKKHLESGAKKVIVSCPANDPDITMVLGVNTDLYSCKEHDIISNASCTTNCLATVIKVIKENFGFENGMMTTIHSYNQDQRLLDYPNKDLRRARAGALSMIPTTTGAAKAVTRVFPDIEGKITGMSVRVPVPNVSLIDLVLKTKLKDLTINEINSVFKKASEGMLKGILDISYKPLVSIDYLGNSFSSTVDALSTDICGDLVKIIAWYDNESGYSKRLVELITLVGNLL